MTTPTAAAAQSGTVTLGDDLTVRRLGYGTMRLTGQGIWGEPADRGEAIRVLRRAVELGVDFFDTADSYGPFVAEDLLREALHPYDGLTVATKGGLLRTGPDVWIPLARPEYLRQCVEMSLRRLGLEQIDVYQLHRVDPQVPLAEQLGALKELQDAGKIRHIGLSNVALEQIEQGREIVDVVSVQNRYNLVDRQSEDVLEHCEREGIAFIPWRPIADREQASLGPLAAQTGSTPTQLALAWLLRRSPVMLPIPGTSTVAHLEENVGAAAIELSDQQADEISAVA